MSVDSKGGQGGHWCWTRGGASQSSLAVANTNLPYSTVRSGCLADKWASKKVRKYSACAERLGATHLPFAVESMGGLSESALQLVREIHHSAGTSGTWRDPDTIGAHLLDSIAIAVQRGCGMAVRASMDGEMRRVFGAAAA